MKATPHGDRAGAATRINTGSGSLVSFTPRAASPSQEPGLELLLFVGRMHKPVMHGYRCAYVSAPTPTCIHVQTWALCIYTRMNIYEPACVCMGRHAYTQAYAPHTHTQVFLPTWVRLPPALAYWKAPGQGQGCKAVLSFQPRVDDAQTPGRQLGFEPQTQLS